ncbi:MAG: acetate/propionate family kinase [Caulobacteraceae bacterium]
MAEAVLALNAGSATVKFALYAMDAAGPALRLRGLVEGLGGAPRMRVKDGQGHLLDDEALPGDGPRDTGALADAILAWTEQHLAGDRLAAVSHRFVHGGLEFHAPTLLTPQVLDRLQALCALAPLHEPYNLAMARTVAERRPDLGNVACFDTAFFHDLPATAARLAIPREWAAKGVRRYGFHGLSYDYLQRRLQALTPLARPRRVVFAHLGSGASLCACLDGRPVETTMGFSALDGLVMGARCGALDPGVVLYLLQQGGMTAAEVEDMLYRHSGLLGVSGLSSDMRTLLASDAAEAKEAVELFVHHVVRNIGALTACLGGLDALVFSAGIGEGSAEIRRRVCERLDWLGLELNTAANEACDLLVSAPVSAVSVWVIPTDEERGLAEGAAVLAGLTQRKATVA